MRFSEPADRSLTPPEEPAYCSKCDDRCTDDDPVWRGQPVHLGCVDWDDVAGAVRAAVNDGALLEAAELYRAAADDALEELDWLRMRRERAAKDRTCVRCMGPTRVKVESEPVPTYVDVDCRCPAEVR